MLNSLTNQAIYPARKYRVLCLALILLPACANAACPLVQTTSTGNPVEVDQSQAAHQQSHDEKTAKSKAQEPEFRNAIAALRSALIDYSTRTGHLPENDQELNQLVSKTTLPASLKDPWGSPYEYLVLYEDQYTYNAGSATPNKSTRVATGMEVLSVSDQRFRTTSDIVVADIDLHGIAPDAQESSPPILQSGEVMGVVIDQTGEVRTNALITAADVNTGKTFSARTNRTGGYNLRLPAGSYLLAVEHEGFQRALVSSVPVVNGTITGLDIRLSVPARLTRVEVCEQAGVYPRMHLA